MGELVTLTAAPHPFKVASDLSYVPEGLTPQSRYGPRAAATAGQLPPDGPKPWE